LVNSPVILLADEPTGNLDQEISQEILQLFEEAHQRGVTVVIATHNQDILRAGKHPVITLNRGKVIQL
jgi:cell division transport system ATP-binding protein